MKSEREERYNEIMSKFAGTKPLCGLLAEEIPSLWWQRLFVAYGFGAALLPFRICCIQQPRKLLLFLKYF